jgi:hypothetical protein
MKKFIFFFLIIFLLLFSLIVTYLTIFGLETSKFNNLIVREIKTKDSKIELELAEVKIKLDIKKLQLFVSTNKPKLTYQNINIPITEVKIYSKINKILNSKFEVSQIFFAIEKFKIQDVQKLAVRIKPSNFKNYLLNNINGGEIEKALFNLNTDKNFKIINYKASGSIKKIDTKITNDFIIEEVSFNFIADNNLTLVNSINAKYNGIEISNGSINIKQKKKIEIKGKFDSQFNLTENQLNKLITNINFFKENKVQLQGSLLHDFSLKMNNNFKIIDYEYKSSGNILKSQIIIKNNYRNNFIKEPIKKVLFEKTKLEIVFNKNNNNLLILDGFYNLDNSNYNKFKVNYNLNKKNKNFFIDLDLSKSIFFDLINFRTDSKKKSNVKIDYSIKNKKHFFKSIDFTVGKNVFSIKNLLLNNKKEVEKFSTIKVQTYDKNKETNNFIINFGKKISIVGKNYDSTNLLKSLSKNKKSNLLKKLNKEIKIQIKNLTTKSGISLGNFNLIGLIEKGDFNMISAKSEFSENKYLDISLKKDTNNKKIIEVYSDSPQALLGEYKFFEGIREGKLLYTSIIDKTGSVSKLTIENFKVIKAPAFATLLTLADLGGYADLLSGQGMSFDNLEINLRDDFNVITVEEILALGSSVSLHMEGYVEKKTGLVSLNGTLVPAKMLNSLISKIPVVGGILVGDKVGDGVFGVSFKIKGLPEKIKTTVNPVKTITPRFITRAIEKMKRN